MKPHGLRAGSLVALAALLGCTPIRDQIQVKPPSPLPAAAKEPGSPAVPWQKKNHAERMEFMGLYFFPKMRAVFQAHDPKATFRCQTCHGEDMDAVSYRMPHGLYALPTADPVAAANDYDPAVARFMIDEVSPAARTLLGIEPGEGPACHLCHEAE